VTTVAVGWLPAGIVIAADRAEPEGVVAAVQDAAAPCARATTRADPAATPPSSRQVCLTALSRDVAFGHDRRR
jgi:hypothetical protein